MTNQDIVETGQRIPLLLGEVPQPLDLTRRGNAEDQQTSCYVRVRESGDALHDLLPERPHLFVGYGPARVRVASFFSVKVLAFHLTI